MKRLLCLLLTLCMFSALLPATVANAEGEPVLNKRYFDLIGATYGEVCERYGAPMYSFYWEGNSCFAFDDENYLLFFSEVIYNGDFMEYGTPGFTEPDPYSICTIMLAEVDQLFGGAEGCTYTLDQLRAAMGVQIPDATYDEHNDEYSTYFEYSNLSFIIFPVIEGKVVDGETLFMIKTMGQRFFVDPDPTVRVFVDRAEVNFDQPPVIEDGRTLAPVRAIFEALGFEVEWEEPTQTVYATKGEDKITLKINDTTAYVNGEAKILDVPARLVNGRTLVPLRFISENAGAEVVWNGVRQMIDIWYNEENPAELENSDDE